MKMYIVSYSSGSDEDWREYLIFATHDEEKADKYIEKANNMLEKWCRFLEEKLDNELAKELDIYPLNPRYEQLEEINGFYKQEIEVR